MRRTLAVLTCFALTAWAGEVYLGTTEMNPPNGSSNFYSDGGGFKVPINQKLSVWCSATGFLLTGRNVNVFSDGGTGDAGPGIPYDTARVLFPTSSSGLKLLSDAGSSTASGGNIVISTSTATGNLCHWYLRDGTE